MGDAEQWDLFGEDLVAVFGVFDEPAGGFELEAEGVGGGPVAGLFGLPALFG